MSDPLWQAFLDDAGREIAIVRQAASADAVAGALFALRCAAAVFGVEPIARAAAAAERAVSVRPLDELAPSLVELAAALSHAVEILSHPDRSGARLDDPSALTALTTRLRTLANENGNENGNGNENANGNENGNENENATATADELWIPQVDADMIEPFLDEAQERIEALSQKLLRLEAAPDDAELLRDIFRDLHTVKGSSAFVGLARMNKLAHAAENLVAELREGTRRADRGVIDALLHALDGLRAILTAATNVDPKAGVRIDFRVDEHLARLRNPVPVPVGVPVPLGVPAPAAHAESRTLRVDFDKLDTLVNLVGELALAKSDLADSVAAVAVLGRELDGLVRRARGRGRGRLERTRPPLAHGVPLDDAERFVRILRELSDHLGDGATALGHVSTELRQRVMKLRMLPVGRLFTKHHRTVRELAHALGKRAQLVVEGGDTELDKVLLEQLDDPLLHLVRNALDHGIEAPAARRAAGKPEEGTITLRARQRGNQIIIEVGDDGAGIDPARLREKAREKKLASDAELAAMDDTAIYDVIFRPGFSTAAKVTEVSGRGVGMDVVRETLTRLSGTVELSSAPGAGTTFVLKLPLTLAILHVLGARIGGERCAFPIDQVVRTLAVRPADVHLVCDRRVIFVGDEQVPLLSTAAALGFASTEAEDELPLVLVEVGEARYGLVVERLFGRREAVLKSLAPLLSQVPCVAGATIIGDHVAVILDVAQVVQRALNSAAAPAPLVAGPAADSDKRRPRILLAEDSEVVREQWKRVLEAHGYEVVGARDGAEALAIAQKDGAGFDLVSSDVMMPNVDGYELVRALRQQARHKDVPMIMVTSRGEQLDRVRGFDAGVDDYLVKPIDSAELLRAVERHLRGRA